jgi:hypothetical protein
MPKPRKAVAEMYPTTDIVRNVVSLPPAIERVYRLVREGSIGNLRVQELTIQGDQVTERRFVSERDAKPFALARLMGLIEDQIRREQK